MLVHPTIRRVPFTGERTGISLTIVGSGYTASTQVSVSYRRVNNGALEATTPMTIGARLVDPNGLWLIVQAFIPSGTPTIIGMQEISVTLTNPNDGPLVVPIGLGDPTIQFMEA
jgi:hypothetical protein